MKFLKNTIRSLGVVLATTVVTTTSTSFPQEQATSAKTSKQEEIRRRVEITQEQKDILLAKLQPIMDKYFQNKASPTGAKNKPATVALGDERQRGVTAMADGKVVNRSKASKISPQCQDELENSSYALEMNLGNYYGSDIVSNDNPVWTTWLMILFAFYAEELQVDPDFPAPYGLCAMDKKNKFSCDAALLSFSFDVLLGLSADAFLYYVIPFTECLEKGGTIAHTSFRTDCWASDFPDYRMVEFFGIPQCVPASCGRDEVRDYCKNQIEIDFNELGFVTGEQCDVTFKIDTKLPKMPQVTSKSSSRNRKVKRGRHSRA
jgi:hypothetical protein